MIHLVSLQLQGESKMKVVILIMPDHIMKLVAVYGTCNIRYYFHRIPTQKVFQLFCQQIGFDVILSAMRLEHNTVVLNPLQAKQF